MFETLGKLIRALFKSVGAIIKGVFYLFLGLIGVGIIMQAFDIELEKSETEKIADIEAAYKSARALPASDACANRNAYQRVIDLEKEYELEKYGAVSKQKVGAYSAPCDEQSIMKETRDGESARKKKMRNVHMSNFENTILMCRGAEMEIISIDRSQPRWILTGDYYNKDNLIRPDNRYKNDEMILRIARDENAETIKYETYQISTIDGKLKDYSFGERAPALKKYDLGWWDLERDTLRLTRLDSQETMQYSGREDIGNYPVEWNFYVRFRCSKWSEPIPDFPSFIETRQVEFSDGEKKRRRNQELQRAREQEANEQAQREANQI